MKILIIGGGAVSEKWHIPAAVKLVGADKVFLAEPDIDRQQYLRGVFDLHTVESDYRALLEKVDIAIVATPPHLHPAITVECLKSHNPVLCEKPFANSVKECKSILRVAERTDTKLGVCHNYRLFPNRQYVRDKIKAGCFGKNVLIDIHEGGVASWPTRTGYAFRKEFVPGGVLLNNGLHSLDFMLWCFGETSEIDYCDDSIGGLESNADVRLTFNNGCKGRLRISRTCKMQNQIFIKGDADTITMNTFEMNRVFNQNGSEQSIDKYKGESVMNFEKLSFIQLKEFTKAVEDSGPQFCTGREGAAVIDLIDQCYSIKNRRVPPTIVPLPGLGW